MTDQPESTLNNSEARFRSVLENISLIAIMLDPEGCITFCNKHLMNLSGGPPSS